MWYWYSWTKINIQVVQKIKHTSCIICDYYTLKSFHNRALNYLFHLMKGVALIIPLLFFFWGGESLFNPLFSSHSLSLWCITSMTCSDNFLAYHKSGPFQSKDFEAGFLQRKKCASWKLKLTFLGVWVDPDKTSSPPLCSGPVISLINLSDWVTKPSKDGCLGDGLGCHGNHFRHLLTFSSVG